MEFGASSDGEQSQEDHKKTPEFMFSMNVLQNQMFC